MKEAAAAAASTRPHPDVSTVPLFACCYYCSNNTFLAVRLIFHADCQDVKRLRR